MNSHHHHDNNNNNKNNNNNNVGDAGNAESRRRPTANAESSHIKHPAYTQDLLRYVLNSVDGLGLFMVCAASGFEKLA